MPFLGGKQVFSIKSKERKGKKKQKTKRNKNKNNTKIRKKELFNYQSNLSFLVGVQNFPF